MFVVFSSINAKNLETTQYPSTGEWINKLVWPNNGILFNGNRGQVSTNATTQMNIKSFMLGQRSWDHKASYL